MVINWYGEGCFKIQSSDTTILIDPFANNTGLTPPRFKTDLTIKTLTSTPIAEATKEDRVIEGAGEYEVKGIEISGWQLEKESNADFLKTVYVVRAEEMKLGFLGHLSNQLDPEVMGELVGVDILFVPAGGEPFVSQEAIAKLIKQIEPKIVVPSFFKIPDLKRKADDVRDFLKELEKDGETQEKLTIKQKDLPEKMKVVVLKV